jgi:subtilisin family serine protease
VIRPELLPLPYPKPDVGAPGVAVESSVPGGGWAILSGSSMAAPHASGALALVLSATEGLAGVGPEDRAGALIDAMIGGARPLGEAGQDHRYGFGRIDVLRSIGLARERGR